MQREVSLAYLTIPGIEALDQIKLAAEAGYDAVSLRTIPMGQPGEPQNDLVTDRELFCGSPGCPMGMVRENRRTIWSLTGNCS